MNPPPAPTKRRPATDRPRTPMGSPRTPMGSPRTPMGSPRTPVGSPRTPVGSPRTPVSYRTLVTPTKGDPLYKFAERIMKGRKASRGGTTSVMFKNIPGKITKFAISDLKTNNNTKKMKHLRRELELAKEASKLKLGPVVYNNSNVYYNNITKQYYLVLVMNKLDTMININKEDPEHINFKKHPKLKSLYNKLLKAGFNVSRNFHTGQIVTDKSGKYLYIDYGRVKPTGELKERSNRIIK